jgi:hypothetical protein
MFDKHFNSAGAKCARNVPELRNKKMIERVAITLELQGININLFHSLFLHIKHVKKGIYPCFNEGE